MKLNASLDISQYIVDTVCSTPDEFFLLDFSMILLIDVHWLCYANFKSSMITACTDLKQDRSEHTS